LVSRMLILTYFNQSSRMLTIICDLDIVISRVYRRVLIPGRYGESHAQPPTSRRIPSPASRRHRLPLFGWVSCQCDNSRSFQWKLCLICGGDHQCVTI
jgi:hypothetical protein